MDDISLENTIRQYVHLPSRQTTKGWWVCKCEVCNDYKKRGGFKFEGDVSSFHCFNCNHAAKHDPHEYASLSENMQKVMDGFNIPDDEYKQVLFNAFKLHNSGDKKQQQQVTSDPDTKLVKIPLPNPFILLEDATDNWAIIARDYLEHDRGLDPSAYPYYIMDDEKHDKFLEKKWRGRLIIPYYRKKQLVWYQGRDLRPASKMRYLNAQTESECILSNYEKLFDRTDEPLYICEGFFDAMSVDGIAIFGNAIKAGQLKLLNRSPRRKVYIPDTKGDGHIGALQAIKAGWEVSIPDIGSVKDMNDAVLRFGKLYVLKSLKDHTLSGFQAEIRVNTLCESPSTRGKKRGKR